MNKRVLVHAFKKQMQGGGMEPGLVARKPVRESSESFYAVLGRQCELCRDALLLRSRRYRSTDKAWTGIARRLADSAGELRPTEAAVLCHLLAAHLTEGNETAREALAAVAATHFYSKLSEWTGKELAMWSSASTVHRPPITREAYRVLFDHIEKNWQSFDVDDAVVLVSALVRSKEKIHSSLRKHINSVTRELVKSLPISLPKMTVKSVVQAAQLVPLEKEDIHKTIREEITNRDDVTAHCWAQLLRMYAEGNDDWVGAIWRKVVEEISSNDDGKATAIILNALARSHSKQAHIRYSKLPDMNSSSKWDVHSVAICCISLARLAQTQDVIGAVEVDDMFAQLEGFLITKVDLSRSSNLLQLKQLALGFSLVYMEKVSNTLWKSIAVAAMDGRVPGSGEDRIGVLGSLSVGYPLGKATREIESLARTIIDVVDLTKVNQRSFHLLVMKLVKMRYFPVEVMSKVEACIEKDPDRIIPNGEALLSLVHFLFACNSDHAELWRIAMAKLDVLYDGMTTEDLFASVGFMTTCNRRPSDQVADDVLSRLSEPSDHYQALMASMALCRADLALQLPVHEVAMKILVSMRSTKLHTDTLQECVNMLCQVALLSGSPQLMQQIINDLTRFPLRNTNMSWLAWSAAMLNSLDFIPMALLRSMLRVNLNYRHPVAGFCRDSRMAQRVQETLICIGGGFSTEAERGGFQIDFVSDYQSVV